MCVSSHQQFNTQTEKCYSVRRGHLLKLCEEVTVWKLDSWKRKRQHNQQPVQCSTNSILGEIIRSARQHTPQVKKTEKYLVCWPFFGSLRLHVYQIFRREKDKKTIRNKSMTLTALNMEKNNQLFPCNFLISTGNFHCRTLSERNLDFINQ